ncbi:MAG: arginyltransferase [Rhodobacteraceae bacterium]|nr:arginyltransferase [Paracoccaceae bacterium]MCY4138990.1 arginyltransferase [Paracoccaceae bacterium]
MQLSVPINTRFFVTAPHPCPYREGFVEQRLCTTLPEETNGAMNDVLSRHGFRRSQNILYRPTCPNCRSCLSTRICVEEFSASRSQRRILKRNSGLVSTMSRPRSTPELYELFRRYLEVRHQGGGMTNMRFSDFSRMMEEAPEHTRMIVYTEYSGRDSESRPVSACLTDILSDGPSLVYSFFEPHARTRSLGTFMILDHINLARSRGLPHVYLGYWVPGSPKMDYKGRFSSLQVFIANRWRNLEDLPGLGETRKP